MTNLELAAVCHSVYMEIVCCMSAHGHCSLDAQHQIAVHHGLACNKAKLIWKVTAIGRSYDYYIRNLQNEDLVLLNAELADLGWTYKSFF